MNILKGEHGGLGLKGAFELKQKQHGQQDHRHMVVPAAPADDWVFIQTGQAFGILQGALDPIAARLPLGQEAGRQIDNRIWVIHGLYLSALVGSLFLDTR